MPDDRENIEKLTFWEHFDILRRYILIGGTFFFVCSIILFAYASALLTNFLLKPLHGEQLVFLTPTGPFFFEIHISLIGAAIVSFPVWLFLLSRFAGDALPQRKRRRFVWFVLAAAAMGGASLVLSYRYLVPTSFRAFSQYVVPGTSLMLTADGYVNFVFLVTTVCFVVVELPVVIVALVYVRLVNPFWLSQHRRYLYLGILVLLGIVTPTTDAVTLLAVCVSRHFYSQSSGLRLQRRCIMRM
jgi:Sec-independent protein secretion pathway component TatC